MYYSASSSAHLKGQRTSQANGAYLAMMVMNAVDYMDDRARPARAAIEELPRSDPNVSDRFNTNIGDIIDKTLADLDEVRPDGHHLQRTTLDWQR